MKRAPLARETLLGENPRREEVFGDFLRRQVHDRDWIGSAQAVFPGGQSGPGDR